MPPLAALLLIAPALVAAGPPLAVLSLDGSAQAAAIDEGVRAGLSELGAYDVQAAELTGTHVRSATEMGVTCPPSDSFCLRKLAVLAEVQFVIAPRLADGESINRIAKLKAAVRRQALIADAAITMKTDVANRGPFPQLKGYDHARRRILGERIDVGETAGASEPSYIGLHHFRIKLAIPSRS